MVLSSRLLHSFSPSDAPFVAIDPSSERPLAVWLASSTQRPALKKFWRKDSNQAVLRSLLLEEIPLKATILVYARLYNTALWVAQLNR
jgi:hypothetical protein